jgi:hypothetical protein
MNKWKYSPIKIKIIIKKAKSKKTKANKFKKRKSNINYLINKKKIISE